MSFVAIGCLEELVGWVKALGQEFVRLLPLIRVVMDEVLHEVQLRALLEIVAGQSAVFENGVLICYRDGRIVPQTFIDDHVQELELS